MKKIRRIISFFLALCMIMTLMPEVKVSAGETLFSGGSGTENNPYLLANADDFIQLTNNVKGGEDYSGKYFKIPDDVTDPIELSSANGFFPIGDTDGNQFEGILDGNGKTIKLNLDLSDTSLVGLFGNFSGLVKNLTVTGSVTGDRYVGGIAGESSGTIMNCHNQASVNGANGISCAGGIAGSSMKYDGVINCTNSGQVAGGTNVGGIVGFMTHVYITNCLNNGEVKANNLGYEPRVGGIVGCLGDGSIKNCVNNGSVIKTGSEYEVGGIAGGFPTYNVESTVSNCYYNASKNPDAYDYGYYISDEATARKERNFAKTEEEIESEATLESLNSYAKTNKEDEYVLFAWQLENHVFSLVPRTYEIKNESKYLTVDKSSALQGDTVEITINELPSYMRIASITLNGTPLSPDAAGKYIFNVQDQDVSIAAELSPNLEKNSAGQYQISSAEDLIIFSQAVNNGFCQDDAAVLIANFSVSTGDGFTPIGSQAKPFRGKFYGDGFTVTLDISKGVDFGDTKATGLFGVIDEAAISDLILKGTVNGGENNNSYTGAVVAVADNAQSKIGNIYSEVEVSGAGYVGGIVGCVNAEQNISLCNIVNNGTVKQLSTAEDKKAVGSILGKGQKSYTNVYFNSEKNSGIYDSGYSSDGSLMTGNDEKVIAANAVDIFTASVAETMNEFVLENTGWMKTYWDISQEDQTVKLVKKNPFYTIYKSVEYIKAPDGSKDGKTVTVQISLPEEADDLKTMVCGVVVKDSDGKTIETTDKGDGSYQFVMPQKDVTISLKYDLGIKTTLVNDKTYVVVKTADDFVKVMNSVVYGNSDVNVMLDDDITLTSEHCKQYLMETSTIYQGIFDGAGHTVTAEGLSRPLFGVIGQKGAVNHLTVDGKIGMEASGYCAGIAYANIGVIVNCINKATILGTTKAGIVWVNAGVIVNSINKGTLDADSPGIVYANTGVALNVANENKQTSGELAGMDNGITLGTDLSAQTDPKMWEATSAQANYITEAYNKNIEAGATEGILEVFATSNIKLLETSVLKTDTEEGTKAEMVFADENHMPYYLLKTTEDTIPYQTGSTVEVTLPTKTVEEGYEIYGAQVTGLLSFDSSYKANPVADKENTYSFTMPRMSCTIGYVVAEKGLEQDDNGYFLVKSKEDFMKVKSTIKKGNRDINVKLMTDITGYTEGPISVSGGYEGTFDGNNHSIEFNVEDNESHETYGLFEQTGTHAVIKNLTVKGKLTVNANYAGGIVGLSEGSVKDCVNNATIVNTSASGITGGIVGETTGMAMINGCVNKGDIRSSKASGGIVGQFVNSAFYTTSSLSNCINYGKIGSETGTELAVAGIAALTENTKIEDCMNLGEIKGNNGYAAGIGIYAKGKIQIVNCFNGGAVSGENACGIASRYSGTGEDVKVAIENTFYLQTESVNAGIDLSDKAEVEVSSGAVSKEEVESGKVAYLLRSGQSNGKTLLWGQTLSGDKADKHPVLGGMKVFKIKTYSGCKNNPGELSYTYSNEEKETVYSSHIKDNGTRVEPTCEEKGSITYKCTVCGEVIEVVELDAKGHTWDAGKVTKDATETAEGEKTYTCKVCGKTKTESIPKLQTNPKDNEPAKQNPAKQEPAKKETLKNGDMVKDDKAKGKYIMVSVTQKEVAYRAPVNKKAKSVSVPSTVKIKGVTYKVTGIADNALKGNKKVTKVTISSNVNTIGKMVFYGCKKLKTVTIESKELTSKTVSKKAFKGMAKATTIMVPKNKLKAYKKLFKSKGLSSKVKIKKY